MGSWGRGRALAACALVMLLAACTASTEKPDLTKSTEAASIVGSSAGDMVVVARLSPPAGANGSQRIHENDLLDIDVFQVDELDRKTRVDGRGNIAMPLIGQVRAKGLTPEALATALERRYGANYLQSPDISVQIVESTGEQFALDGEFKKTGVYPATAQTSLLRAVALGGGLTDTADESKIFIYRRTGQKTEVAQYSVAAIRAGRAPDPRLYGGDVVVAFTSQSKVAAQNLKDVLGIARSATGIIGF